MKILRGLSLLFLLMFVASCQSQHMMMASTPSIAPKVTPIAGTELYTITTPIVPKSPPVGMSQDCDSYSGNKCLIKVEVKVEGDICYAKLKEYVHLQDMAKTKRIEWQLPSDYKFCTRNGDGVFFERPVSAPFDPDPNGPCKSTYGWKRNDLDNIVYGYFLRFRNDTSTLLCEVDPFFNNG